MRIKMSKAMAEWLIYAFTDCRLNDKGERPQISPVDAITRLSDWSKFLHYPKTDNREKRRIFAVQELERFGQQVQAEARRVLKGAAK